jgi:hypothetical protein
MTKTLEILPGDSIVFVAMTRSFDIPPLSEWILSEFVFSESGEPPQSFLNWKTLGKGSKEEMVILGESLGLEPKVIEGCLVSFWKDPSGRFLLETEDGK